MNRRTIGITAACLLVMMVVLLMLNEAAAVEETFPIIVGWDDERPERLFDFWEARAPMPSGRDRAAAAVAEGAIVVVGGWDRENGLASGATEIYDPVSDRWMVRESMPSSRMGLAAAAVEGEVYAIGGWSSATKAVTGVTEAYDPQTDNWRTASPLPLARSGLAAVSVGGRIYAIGGWDGERVSDAVSIYDPQSDRWTPVAPLPTARSGLAAVTLENKIYAIGGFDGSWMSGKVEVYDPMTDSWSSLANLERPRWNLGAGIVRGRIFVVGGNEWHDEGAALYVNEVYDAERDAWRPARAMPTERWGLVVVGEGDWLYAIGGNDFGHKTNEAYSPFAPHSAFLPMSLFDPYGRPPDQVVSKPLFQVFILNPVRTCLVGNDFASGTLCRGTQCGDCNCTWEQFDPPAPIIGVAPGEIDDPRYAGYAHKVCLEMSLTQAEITDIVDDMEKVREEALAWSGGALDLQMEYRVLAHDHTGFVAPDYVYGPFEVDDELLNEYVTTETDFVYIVAPVHDRKRGVHLAYACGGSYGEMTVRGAGYAEIQYNELCNSVMLAGREVYEPLVHEWLHNLDWALFYINERADAFQYDWPDWENWQPGTWPACGMGSPEPMSWFPSVDLCEWDPDWIDCNNISSAGACLHAGEVAGQMSWYEHAVAVHYPRMVAFVGNHCRDGRKDFGETDVDIGGPCP